MELMAERSEWFDIPNDLRKGRLKVKYLNEGQKQEMLEDVNDTKFTANKKGEEEAVSKFNSVEFRKAIATGRIEDWENMFDIDKKTKLECSDENKIKFSALNGFMEMLSKLVIKLDKMVEKELKKEVKNSKSSPAG